MKGIVVKFNQQKGYGFIRTKGETKDFFVHIKDVKNAKTLNPGQQVEFELSSTKKGPAATSVVAGKKSTPPYALFFIVAIIILLPLTIYLYQYISLIAAYIIAINAITTLMYAYDKIISGSSAVRIPEKVLHGLAFIGGSPAALAAQKMFRHKTIKRSFQAIYWGIVLLQLSLIIFTLYIKGIF